MSPPVRQDLLVEAGLALSSELSLPVVLQRIVDLAAQVTDARYGALGVLGEDGRTISEFVTTGISKREREAIGALPRGRGLLGALLEEARPLRLARIADDPRSAGFPPHHPPMTTFLGAPVRALGRVYGNLYLTEKRGAGEFTAEDEDHLVVLATQAGIAIANSTLYEESHLRERRLDALRQINGAILADAPIASVLQMVCRLARDLAGADLATIVSPAGEAGGLAVTAADGVSAARLEGLEVPIEGSVSGAVLLTGTPTLLDDARRDRRTYQPMVRLGNMGPSIFVPLAVRGATFGTLAVSRRHGGPAFPASALHLVETFADQAALALDFSRARRDSERLAVMDDRERIAKDMHDGIVQSLFAVGMGLQATAALVQDAEVQTRLEGAVGQIDGVIRDLRNYIFGLRPGILADRQLAQALRTLGEEFTEEAEMRVDLAIDPEVAAELAPQATDVVQLAREALSNVHRHAGAASCSLTLRRQGRRAVLTVQDDGRGFDPKRAAMGQGLANMRARVARLGGTLRLVTAPGRGTRIRMALPLG